MKLRAKCCDEYFKLLDIKTVEFRQFESIVLENSETGEEREFLVKDIRKLHPAENTMVQITYPKVPWNREEQIFAIELGDELDRNDVISVPQPAHQTGLISDRKTFEIPETEKTWHGVGE